MFWLYFMACEACHEVHTVHLYVRLYLYVHLYVHTSLCTYICTYRALGLVARRPSVPHRWSRATICILILCAFKQDKAIAVWTLSTWKSSQANLKAIKNSCLVYTWLRCAEFFARLLLLTCFQTRPIAGAIALFEMGQNGCWLFPRMLVTLGTPHPIIFSPRDD